MICSKCGGEIQEGKMYCETCGMEIHMVPDFEPEIENKIEESISSMIQNFTENDQNTSESSLSNNSKTEFDELDEVASDFSDDEFDDFDDLDLEFSDDDDLENDDFWDIDEVVNLKKNPFEKIFSSKILGKVFIVLAAVLVLVAVFVAVRIGVSTSQKNSYDYQLKMSQAAYDKGDYKDAVNYLEKAIKINSSDTSLKYLLSDYYCKAGLQENAVFVLQEIILGKDENKLEAYQKLFDIYSEDGRIDEINRILSETDDEEILLKFQQYTAQKPEFNMPEGKYTENFYLKIVANTNGTIYYTLDGTTPTKDSEVYTSPIFLENGYYTVNAYFVNSFGQSSEISTIVYDVNSSVPAKPIVNLESGSFNMPELITVETAKNYEYVIYYTTDGSEPNMESNMYVGPICMPLGKSTFSFVAISTSDEVASEIVTYNYELNLPSSVVTPLDASNAVIAYRYNLGDLIDMEGHLSTVSGRLVYMCDSAIYMNNNYFYVVTEYFENADSRSRTKTGLQYVVAVNAPVVLGSLERNEDGEFYCKGV